MGMIWVAHRLSEEQVREFVSDPDAFLEELEESEDTYRHADDYSDAGSPRMIDLDKSWHGLHFLLAGTEWEPTAGAGEAILDGEEFGEDGGYGPARLLDADAVRRVSAALADLDADETRRRFDPAALQRSDIYPQIWDEGDEARDYLVTPFPALKAFYAGAAAAGDSVVISVM